MTQIIFVADSIQVVSLYIIIYTIRTSYWLSVPCKNSTFYKKRFSEIFHGWRGKRESCVELVFIYVLHVNKRSQSRSWTKYPVENNMPLDERVCIKKLWVFGIIKLFLPKQSLVSISLLRCSENFTFFPTIIFISPSIDSHNIWKTFVEAPEIF